MGADTGYYCRDCECCFDAPELSVERHGLDTPPYETFYVCPNCKSTDYVPIIRCDCCGQIITDTYIHIVTGEDYCPDCYMHKEVV